MTDRPHELVPPFLLLRDTFRQARASGVSLMMLAVTAVCVLICLTVKVTADVSLHGGDEPPLFLPVDLPRPSNPDISLSAEAKAVLAVDPALATREGVDLIRGRLTMAFGAVSFPISRERVDAVKFIETILGGAITGTFGLLLALVWTSGFLPTFLEPGAASVLIAKPIARWRLLMGKYASVLVFMGGHVALFVGLTWLALGVRTGIWDRAYLWCVPLILLQFAVYYGFSVLLAVTTRSTVACVLGSLLCWLLSWGINYGSIMAHDLPESQALPRTTLVLANACYWISPKPIDAALILFNNLDASRHFEKPVAFKLLESSRSFSPVGSIASSLLLAAVLLGLSCHEFNETDY